MKRIAIVIIMILALGAFAMPADAADVMYRGKTHDVAWDTAALEDGTPCADCRYYLFAKNMKTGAEVKVGDVAGLAATLILPAEGRWRPGVQAYRTVVPEVPGEDPIVDTSAISWADDPLVCAGGQTFWFRWFQAPQGPKGFQKKQP
jgi:hypothetical protein